MALGYWMLYGEHVCTISNTLLLNSEFVNFYILPDSCFNLLSLVFCYRNEPDDTAVPFVL